MNWLLRLLIASIAIVGFIAVAVQIGPHIGDDIASVERWIARQGMWAPVFFAVMLTILTSLFIPDALLATAAGALFGIAGGTAVTVIGSLAAQCIAFWISRYFLHERVERVLVKRPKLAAIQRAASHDDLRLQILLRLLPLNAVFVSHVIGITRVGFTTFLVACLGLLPGLFVEVYCGYTAKHMLKVAGHVSEHSKLHTTLVVAGLAVGILVLTYVTRFARKEFSEADRRQS